MSHATCHKCKEYFVEDLKFLIKVNNNYYCILCMQNKQNFFINNSEIVYKIINRNIDINTKNKYDSTYLHYACGYASENSKILINKGIPFDTKSKYDNRLIDLCKKK